MTSTYIEEYLGYILIKGWQLIVLVVFGAMYGPITACILVHVLLI